MVDEATAGLAPDGGIEALKAALSLERIREAALAEEEAGNHRDRISLQRERISALGGNEPWTFLTGLKEGDATGVAEDAREALDATADAFREVASWSLSRHVKEKLSLATASEEDLTTLEEMAWLTGVFPAGGLRLAALGTLDAMGFDVRRRGVRLDLEKRQGGAGVFALSIPSRVWVALSPLGVPSDWRQLFAALGRGFGYSSVSPLAPVEEVWTGDALLGRAFGVLLGELVGSRLFLQKEIGASRSEIAEVGRAWSVASLVHLRRSCARVLVEEELWRHGATPRALRTVAEIREMALGVRPGDDLEGTGPELPAWTEARALSLAAGLERALFERFDEDWWRNPRTGPFLQGLFAPGTRGSPEGIAALLEGGEPSLVSWATRTLTGL